uniref:Myosin heavy chain, clone 203-like n=1 Tax=Dermatophagoides pteronyssinus TaxID=6956 RepID=A0A6P6Y9G6_DERPT|nr:myosin heavy chain, clone 203-like [Dermatophagoides pteronyssinus]
MFATSRRTKERIDEFEAQLECFIKTKRLLLEQFAEETQILVQKHEREIIGLRQKHLVCENNFKSQLSNATQKIQTLETKLENEQTLMKSKIDIFEKDLQQSRYDAKMMKDSLEMALNEKDKDNDELRKLNLNLESKLKLLQSEYNNRRQQLEDKLREYELNQDKDFQEIKKLRDDLSQSLKEISVLHRELSQLSESISNKDANCLRLENDLEECKKQLNLEIELKKESNDRIQALRETLKVSQQENDNLQARLTETQHRMGEEMEKLKTMMTNQQINHEQRFRRSIEEKTQLEEKFKNELSTLEHSLQESRNECDNIRQELKRTLDEKHKLQRQFENQMEKSATEKQSLEISYNNRINDLNKKFSDNENKLKSINDKYETTYNELVKVQNYVISVENDLKAKNSEILNVHEKYNLLEMDRLSLLSETENIKRLLHLETVEKKEKSRQINELNESLSSSQIEIEKLKNVNEQLKRSIEEGDNLRFTLIKDCNELRETLAEVEKSRLDIKSKLNSCQFNCATLNNQLKKRDLELEDLKRKLNSYGEEKKFWQQDLDSTGQSLTQMKTAYERLYQQNVLLQNKISQLESESNIHKQMDQSNKTSQTTEKEMLRRLTRECEQFRDQIAKLESEKKHFERLYIQMEREYNSLKNSFNTQNQQRDFMNAPLSPSTISARKGSTNESILSLTQLLKNDFTTPNPVWDDTTNRSLETLRQKNNELKQKVLGRPTNETSEKKTMKMLSSVSKANASDCCECIYHHHQQQQQQNHRIESSSNYRNGVGVNNQHKHDLAGAVVDDDDDDLLLVDENRNNIVHNDFEIMKQNENDHHNHNDDDDDDDLFVEKLKQAELNAQKVLESCEPEIKKLTNKTTTTTIKSGTNYHYSSKIPISDK